MRKSTHPRLSIVLSIGSLPFLFAASGSLTVAGCGSEPPMPVVAPIPSVMPKVAIVEDRTPVDRPKNLLANAQLASPKTLLDGVKPYLPGKFSGVDPRDILSEVTGGSVLADIVDVEKPIDVAVTINAKDPERNPPTFFVSLAITEGIDIDEKLKTIYESKVEAGGVLRLRPVGASREINHCWVAPALGVSKHRLVCARMARGGPGEELAAVTWLARGKDRPEKAPEYLEAEIDIHTLRDIGRKELDRARGKARIVGPSEFRTGKAALDAILREFARNAVEDVFQFIEDVDRVTFSVAPKKGGVDFGITGVMPSANAWISKLALALGDMGDATGGHVPKEAAKLPAERGMFAWGSAESAALSTLMAPTSKLALDVVDAMASDFAWSKKDHELAKELTKMAFAPGKSAASAGTWRSLGGKSVTDSLPEEFSHHAKKELTSMFPHPYASVGVVDEDSKRSSTFVKLLGQLFERPAVQGAIGKLLPSSWTVKLASKDEPVKGLVKGSSFRSFSAALSHVDEEVKDKKKAKPTVVSLRWLSLIVPDGARTWASWAEGVDNTTAIKNLEEAMAGTAKTPTAAMPGFDLVGDAGRYFVFSLDGMLEHYRTKVNEGKIDRMRARLPDGGKGGIALRFMSKSGACKPGEAICSAGGTAGVRVFLPRDVVSMFLDRM